MYKPWTYIFTLDRFIPKYLDRDRYYLIFILSFEVLTATFALWLCLTRSLCSTLSYSALPLI